MAKVVGPVCKNVSDHFSTVDHQSIHFSILVQMVPIQARVNLIRDSKTLLIDTSCIQRKERWCIQRRVPSPEQD